MPDSARLLDYLPHRPPFRFLTHIDELIEENSGKATWQVTGEESFLAGHFPGMPIVPGVIIIEALAQLSGLVGYHRAPSEGAAGQIPPFRQGKLAHVEVRFDDTVFPPADIVLTSRQVRVLGALRQFDVQAFWQERSVARGRLTLAVAPEAAGDEA